MFPQKDNWTTVLVIFVSLIAVKLGIQNLEWGFKTVRNTIIHIESTIHK